MRRHNPAHLLLWWSVLITGLVVPARSQAQTPQVPYLLWPSTVPVPFPTPLSAVQLNARAFAGPPVPVPLTTSFNVTGITSDGVPYNTGGYDGSSWAFSSELLGPSLNWMGITLPLGPANAPDAVANATVPVPSGTFGQLLLAGSLVNNATPSTGHFVLHYTDGSVATVDQDLSDWVNPRNFPGESTITCTPTRHNYDGSIDLNSVCVYGYSLPVDPARTLASVTLPATRNVVVLAMAALPPVVPGTFTYTPAVGAVPASGLWPLATSFKPASPALFTSAQAANSLTVVPPDPRLVPNITWPAPAPVLPRATLSAAQLDASASSPLGPVQVALPYRVNAFYPDGAQYYERGFDGNSVAFSSTLLGSQLRYAGFRFPLGPPSLPDAATSSTVLLPAGSFSTLYLLAAGANGAQLAQPILVTYTDGTVSTSLLNLSSWRSPQNFAGETVVASTAYANLSSGQQTAGMFSVYGYQIPLDPTRTPATLTLPANTNVLVLAAGLGTGTNFAVAGQFTYTPAAGTEIKSFTTLSTTFQPADTNDFVPASASTSLVVGQLDFVLSAPQGTSMTGLLGDSPAIAFQVAPTNVNYSGSVTFTLEGTLPPLATYTFSPSQIGVGDGPKTVILTLHTQRLSASLRTMPGLLFCALFLMPVLVRKRRRFGSLWVAGLLVLGGCGSGYHDTHYVLTVVATDGHFRHTLPVTLEVGSSAQ